MTNPQGYWYSKEHEWIKLEGNKGKIGITDYAAHKLGDITFVDLPAAGKSVKQFEILLSLESVKAASDIYSPVTGKVIAVNTELENAPELINQSPFEKGWLAELEAADPSEVKNLMDAAAYTKYIEGLE